MAPPAGARTRSGSGSNPASTIEDSSLSVAVLVGVLLVFAPLINGGNTPLALMVLELGSLLLLARLVARPAFLGPVSPWLLFALGLAVVLPLLYLVPIPIDWWAQLPGRGDYLELIRFAVVDSDGNGGVPTRRAASLLPFQTEWGWYALLYPVVLFLTTTGLSEAHLKALLKVFVSIAVLQALLALVQFAQGPDSALRFGNLYYRQSGVGTYVNRNHLAALLYTALPVTLAFLVNCLGSTGGAGRRRRRRLGLGSGNTMFGEGGMGGSLLYAALVVAILLGVIFTRSRAGITLGVVGLLITATVYANRLRSRGVFRLVAVILGVGMLLAISVGLAPVLLRFASPDTIDNARWELFSVTVNAAYGFFPIGTGTSNFAEIFPRFQPSDMNGFVNRAHNDYLELMFEGGVLLLLPVLMFLGTFFYRWKAVLAGSEWGAFRFLQVAAGLGVFLMLLHSLVDFNLHIPANMGYFAFLAAIFFRHHMTQPGDARERRSGSMAPPCNDRASGRRREIPEANMLNPFTDETQTGHDR